MCHAFHSSSTFYQLLSNIDESTARQVQLAGCPWCGGVLHRACYPRKPRGIRSALDEGYFSRWSFCCANRECRRRSTPPSVRFLGRKVYLGVIVVLATALHNGLTPKRREQLIEYLDLPGQTVWRWFKWWRETFAESACWRAERGRFVPPVEVGLLPDSLLGRLTGKDLCARVWQLLVLIAPITSCSCSVRVRINPQNM